MRYLYRTTDREDHIISRGREGGRDGIYSGHGLVNTDREQLPDLL